MNLTTRVLHIFGLMYRSSILFTTTTILLLGCGSGSNSTDSEASNQSATIKFQLEFTQPSDNALKAQTENAIGEADICNDYLIDTIGVQVYRTQDDTEAASAQSDCVEHSLTVTDVPAAESLYVVIKGYVDGNTIWQGQANNIVAEAGQNTDIGIIEMQYIGNDNAGPEIVSSFPIKEAINVDIAASIAVVFNEALAPGSISDQAITVLNNDIPVPGTVTYDPDTYTILFTPTNAYGLDTETTYTAILQPEGDSNSTITDISGQPFDDDLSWSFTTRGANDTTAPQVIATSPVDGSANVSQQTSISVIFSEPMDPNSLNDSVFQLSSDQGLVSGQIAYNDQTRTLSLTPDSALDAATLYTVAISSGAMDSAQNALLESHTWQFWTSGIYIISTSIIPEDGSSGSISPASVTVRHGDDQHFEIKAKPYHHLSKLIVDGSSVVPRPSYFFENVTANHTIQAIFETNAVIISDDSSADEYSPKINSEGHVVWVGYVESNTDYEIFYYNGSSVINISNNANDDHYPQIDSNGNVVWRVSGEGSSYDIYRYDSTDHTVTNISKNPVIDDDFPHFYNNYPQINADGHVVWHNYVESSAGYDIFYYDSELKTTTIISDNSNGNDLYPQINDNGHVVWNGYDGSAYGVYYWNKEANKIPGSSNVFEYPQINSNEHIVWSGSSEYGSDIYFYDDETGSVTNISNIPDLYGISNNSPQINVDGHVLWVSGDFPDNAIYYYDRMAKTVTKISNQNGFNKFPQINANGDVVWEGCTANSSISEIYYYDKKTKTVINISKNPDDFDSDPQINANGYIVWSGYKGSESHIYLSVP